MPSRYPPLHAVISEEQAAHEHELLMGLLDGSAVRRHLLRALPDDVAD